VTIFDFGDFDGHLYIAMEFVEGIDVEQVIVERTPIALTDRLGIAIDVLLGLSYAHKRGVVHRDIKPANIRLGDDGRAKIMDFGVAHLESAKMTATGVMMGTPNYMAPEQVTGEKIGPAADIFSLGAVLYELLTHRKAFGGDSLHNVLFKVVSEDPPALALVVELPRSEELETIVRRALAKDPAKRFQSAQEMANELTGVRASLIGTHESGSLSLSATIAAQARRKHEVAKAPQRSRARWRGAAIVAASVMGTVAIVGSVALFMSSRDVPVPESDRSTAALGKTPEPSAVATANDSVAPGAATPIPAAPTVDSARERVVAPVPVGELEVARAAQRSARDARIRAAAAGASSAQLAPGNTAFALGERLLKAKRYAEAVTAMIEARASWSVAATLAADKQPATLTSPGAVPKPRATIESDSSRPITPSRSAPPVVLPPPVVPAPSPSATTSRGESDAASAAAEINALVASYAHAIESRDIDAIRALYPSITVAQQRGFERFFAAVKTLKASLATAKPEISGSTASALISGSYEYVDAGGQAQRQPVAFQATFRQEAGNWLIASVR
jgi:eukaryotic-like serine/threonine-protein kinase